MRANMILDEDDIKMAILYWLNANSPHVVEHESVEYELVILDGSTQPSVAVHVSTTS